MECVNAIRCLAAFKSADVDVVDLDGIRVILASCTYFFLGVCLAFRAFCRLWFTCGERGEYVWPIFWSVCGMCHQFIMV